MTCLGLQKRWTARNLSFEKAFLNRHLDCPIYTELPSHLYFESDRNGRVLNLNRNLNSVKNAAKVWKDLPFKILRENQLEEMQSAPCVFVGEVVMLICYVDDLMGFAKSSTIASIGQKLRKTFSIKNLAERRRLLGIELTLQEDGPITVKQTILSKTFFEITGLSGQKPVGNLVDTLIRTSTVHQQQLISDESTMFRSFEGISMYLATDKQPDLIVIYSPLGLQAESTRKPTCSCPKEPCDIYGVQVRGRLYLIRKVTYSCVHMQISSEEPKVNKTGRAGREY